MDGRFDFLAPSARFDFSPFNYLAPNPVTHQDMRRSLNRNRYVVTY